MGAAADGTLYVVAQERLLYTVNPATAVPTLVGNTNFVSGCGPVGDSTGRLFNAQANGGTGLFRLDRTTGLGTYIGDCRSGSIYAMAYSDGVMYQFSTQGLIYSVNLDTAATTVVSSYTSGGVGGTIYAAAAPLPVPEPGATLMAASSGLLALGRPPFRRRRR